MSESIKALFYGITMVFVIDTALLVMGGESILSMIFKPKIKTWYKVTQVIKNTGSTLVTGVKCKECNKAWAYSYAKKLKRCGLCGYRGE